tara:strand:+ start:76 stop:495 length:420 start_codon:yes stop_codon:yes gene_type:complete
MLFRKRGLEITVIRRRSVPEVSVGKHLEIRNLIGDVIMIDDPGDNGLKPDQGAIIFGEEGVYLLIPSEPSPDRPSDEAEDIFYRVVDAMTYVMYALDREDWRDEFTQFTQEQAEKEFQKEEEEEEEEKKKKRSHLRVIK